MSGYYVGCHAGAECMEAWTVRRYLLNIREEFHYVWRATQVCFHGILFSYGICTLILWHTLYQKSDDDCGETTTCYLEITVVCE